MHNNFDLSMNSRLYFLVLPIAPIYHVKVFAHHVYNVVLNLPLFIKTPCSKMITPLV
jgi:hypothetical protein